MCPALPGGLLPRAARGLSVARPTLPGVMSTAGARAPEPFLHALRSLRGAARRRPEVLLEEVPGPARIAPFTVALTGAVVQPGVEDDLADGRFVVLHDAAGQDGWHGTFRVVAMLRTAVETELASDPMLGDVAWSWLTDALGAHDAVALGLAGSVTRVTNDSFGGLTERGSTSELEIRASWSPDSPDLGPHLAAWTDALATCGGLPPLPEGVAAFERRR